MNRTVQYLAAGFVIFVIVLMGVSAAKKKAAGKDNLSATAQVEAMRGNALQARPANEAVEPLGNETLHMGYEPAVPAEEPAREPVKGEIIMTPEEVGSVWVQNPTPIKGNGFMLGLGASCFVPNEGTLKLVGWDDSNSVLVRYQAGLIRTTARKPVLEDDEEHPAEDEQEVTCPNGTLFYMDRAIYIQSNPVDIDAVRNLLKQEAR